MLLNIHKPGEKCARTALYALCDKRFRGTGLSEFVQEGRHFPKAGPGDTYWPVLDL